MIFEADNVAIAVGIDIGTSGVRAVAINAAGKILHIATSPFASRAGARNPLVWWRGVEFCLEQLGKLADLSTVEGIAVDGTSGTVVAIDQSLQLTSEASLYNDTCQSLDVLKAVADVAPHDSPARGATSPLARAIVLSRQPNTRWIVHQADWIAMQLTGGNPVSDENNALKTGYDLAAMQWPEWLEKAGLDRALLPEVLSAGAVTAAIGAHARHFGFQAECVVHAGTTDGCASFLATGASDAGDGVTALGSTLVLKMASDRPISAPEYGIYSHRIGDIWLAGGASNSGGGVISALFGDDHLAGLTSQMHPEVPTGLDYYPLLKPGERFPINDPDYPPRLTPRPSDDATFFQGVLEGISAIEALGYHRLRELGAPQLRSIRTVGGGARNDGWTSIRKARLEVPFVAPLSVEAAAGAAQLVLRNRRQS